MSQHHKISFLCAAFVFALFICVGPVGSGVAHASPITISTCTQLQNIGSTTGPLSGSYILAGNIDCSATATWNPISGGGYFGFFPLGNFTGTFNGAGYTISNLYMHTATSTMQGLFSQASATSTIQNVTLAGGSVTGTDYVGALVGQLHASATIQNATSTMAVSGANDVGGLVGLSFAGTTIASSTVNASITPNAGGANIGGVVGSNGGLVQNVSSAGTITSSVIENEVGGIAGTNFTAAQIIGSHSSMSIQLAGGVSIAGGIAGANEYQIQSSYFTGSINASTTSQTSSQVGGIVGGDSSTYGITNSYYNVNNVSIMGASRATPYGIYNAQYSAWAAGNYAPLSFSTYFPSTDGNGYYDITSLSDLENFLAFDETDLSADKFKITAAISVPAEFEIPKINATEFNGGNNAITGVSLTRSGWDYTAAFFPYVASNTTVTAMNLANVSVTGEQAGGIVNYLRGSLTNSTVSGSVTGNQYVGGAIANCLMSCGTISGVQANVNVTGAVYGSDSSPAYIGGFIGHTDGSISNSSALGNVTVASNNTDDVGGFAGYSDANLISNSYATGNVTASGDTDESIGGFLGNSDTVAISNVYATGNVTANGPGSEEIGGLLGQNDSGTIASSSATGLVTATGDGSQYVGGFVGDSYGAISNSFSTGNVIATTTAEYIGGFDGVMESGSATECYSTGNVTGGQYSLGGFAGGSYGPISKSFSTGNIYVYGSSGNDSEYIGGFDAFSEDPLHDDYSTGNIILDPSVGSGYGYYIGGFTGDNDSSITNAYSTGSITGGTADIDVGGFAGYDAGSIYNSYSTGGGTGLMATTSGSVGYFIGETTNNTTVNAAHFYQGIPAVGYDHTRGGLSDALLATYGYGTDEHTLSNFYALSEPVYAQATTTGWDFNSTWETHPNTFPTFQWYSPPTPTYTITATAGTGGIINNAGGLSVMGGANQSYNIITNSGYTIANVLVDGNSVGAVSTYTFTNVAANHTISVTFNAPATSGGGGSYGGGTVTNQVSNLLHEGNTAAAATLIKQYPNLFTTSTTGSASVGSSGSAGTISSSALFTRSLTVGSTGADVLALQKYLNTHGFVIATSGTGSVGHETNYFGKATHAALTKFQKAKGISPASGYFGSLTRTFINAGK